MEKKSLNNIIELYEQTFKFLEEEGIKEMLPSSGPNRTEDQNSFRTVPEKYLLKDNLLLLLKDV